MELSASTLEKMVNDFKPATEEPSEEPATDNDSTEENTTEEPAEETETETETLAEEEPAVLTYNGKDYTVNKAVFEKWLAENGTLIK